MRRRTLHELRNTPKGFGSRAPKVSRHDCARDQAALGEERRARSESMSTNSWLSAPESSSACLHKATTNSRSTDSSWRVCPKMNSRNDIPIVEGAYIPSNSAFIAPLRTTSMSSMHFTPAHIPATTVGSFGAGFADPDLILGAIWTFHRAVAAARSVRPTS